MGKPADVNDGGLAAAAAAATAGTLLGFRAREGVCVCAHTYTHPRRVFLCVCVEGGMFEEMTRVLKILLRGSQTRE